MAQGGYVPLGLRLRATTRLINLKKQHRTPAIFFVELSAVLLTTAWLNLPIK
jgi:hypothetical protein